MLCMIINKLQFVIQSWFHLLLLVSIVAAIAYLAIKLLTTHSSLSEADKLKAGISGRNSNGMARN